MEINRNYLDLKDSYLFANISQKVREYKEANPDTGVISLGIGDVTLPLVPVVVSAMQQAVADMGHSDTFRGYCDFGYPFLRQAVLGYYARKGVKLRDEDLFISDGAKSDVGNIVEIFSGNNTVMIPDPVYPVYVDTNIMAGRKIVHIDGNIENGFLPVPDDGGQKADIIYLCSPNNPTGAVYNREQLKAWVDFALRNDAVLLVDCAYEIFVSDDKYPTSIYQIEGARECAIEFCSLSKTAGFTGTRCGYTVVPSELRRDGASLNKLWLRRQSTKFNGVPYIVQRGAEAVFSDKGLMQIKECIKYYMNNARMIAETLTGLGVWFTGGHSSPYIWLKCPGNMTSWEFFDFLLEKANIVGTPGAGFGKNGEGFFRLTAFGRSDDVHAAMERLREVLPARG